MNNHHQEELDQIAAQLDTALQKKGITHDKFAREVGKNEGYKPLQVNALFQRKQGKGKSYNINTLITYAKALGCRKLEIKF